MRLVCPRCGAQYEIDGAAIPPAGRDVECSACDHVWRALPPPESFDPAARPQLSRPLSDSVIEILREEAARELEVRAAERRSLRAAERASAALAGIGDQDGQALVDDVSPAPALVAGAGSGPGIGAQGVVTDAGTGPEGPDPLARKTDTFPAPAAAARTAPGADFMATERVIAAAPAPATEPSRPSAPDIPAAQPQPTSSATGHRRGYGAGFGLAVIVAVVAVALYALAPRLSGMGPLGTALAEWRSGVDEGREWLAVKGEALTGRMDGEQGGE